MEKSYNSKARFPFLSGPVKAGEWLISFTLIVCLYYRKKPRVETKQWKKRPRLVVFELLKMLPSCRSDVTQL